MDCRHNRQADAEGNHASSPIARLLHRPDFSPYLSKTIQCYRNSDSQQGAVIHVTATGVYGGAGLTRSWELLNPGEHNALFGAGSKRRI